MTQVQRHDPAAYAALPEALRQRYAPSALRLFADTARDRESQSRLRQQVAEDLYRVLRLFAAPSAHAQRSSYQAMERIFQEQCEVQQEKVILKTHAGSTVMQNPSDPDATYDGHKGPGYQVQIAETCHPDNETQLITCALPQTAAVTDEKALAPVPGAAPAERPNDLNIDDFGVDEATECVTCCPEGQTPRTSIHDPATGKTRTTMPASACARCAYRNQCPVEEAPDGYHLEHTAKQRRTAGRRREQETEVFRHRYRRRSGIESTNSGLKRRTGLGRLRVRGRARVFQTLYLKITGWNILRAAACATMRKLVQTKARAAVFCLWVWVRTAFSARPTSRPTPSAVIGASHGWFLPRLALLQAA